MKKFLHSLLLPLSMMIIAACSGGSTGSGSALSLTLSPASVVAGGSVSASTKLTTNKSGFPVNNLSVSYTSNRPDLIHFAKNIATNTGGSSISDQTDTLGVSSVVINVDNSVAIPSGGVNVDISASCAGVVTVQTLTVNAIAGSGGTVPTTTKISVTLNDQSVADTGGQTVATATVTDASGVPLAGQTVSFVKSPATGPVTIDVQNGGVTDSSGKAFATITGTATATIQNVFIYATANGVSNTALLKVTPGTQAPPSSIPKNIAMSFGKSSLTSGEQTLLTATVTDSNGTPNANQAVAFSFAPAATHVTVTAINNGVTDSSGKAYAVVTGGAATSKEIAIIFASAGAAPNTVTGSGSVEILPPGAASTTLPASNVSITLDKTSIQPNGSALATAQITDSAGKVVPAETVTFSVVSGPLTIAAPLAVTTGSDGKCMAVVQATATTNPTYGLIKAVTSNGASQTMAIVVAPAGKPQITLAIAKPVIDATDQEVLATVQVLDSTGQPVNGQSVTFSNVSGPFTINAGLTTVITGIDGKATTKLTPSATPFAANILLGVNLSYQTVNYSLVATATVNPAVNLSVALDSATLDLTGQLIATATATTASGTAVPNQTVTFTLTGPAVLVGQSTTTATDGTAKAVITHDTSNTIGNVIVEAAITVGGTTYRTYATAVPKVTALKLNLVAQSGFPGTPGIGGSISDSPTITVDALTSGVPIKATFTYSDGTPIPNQTVTFSALDPGLFWNSGGAAAANGTSITATTTVNGEAFAVAVPGNFPASGYVNIQASVTVNGATYTQVMPIKVLSGGGGGGGGSSTQIQKSLALDKTALTIAPGATGNVGAIYNLKNSTGDPVSGQNVTFSILSGPATVNGGATATVATDGNGDASALFTAGPNITTTTEIYVNAAVTIGGITYNTVASFTVNPSISFNLVTDLVKVDQSIGAVIATATLKDSAGNPIAGQAVTFDILTGNAAITTAAATTSSDGTAKATITPGAVSSTQNVLVRVRTTLATVVYQQVTSFQIVRGTGILVLSAPPTTAANAKAPAVSGWVQVIPFTLTDSNGNPRPGVAVTLSILSQSVTGGTETFTIENPATVTTDASGKGVFNVTISGFSVAAAGNLDSSAIVWQATGGGITGYAGSTYSLTGT